MRLPITGAAVAAVVLSFGGASALADQPTEDLLKSWVEAIDASPTWTASYGQIASHGDQTTLSDLKVGSEKNPDVTLTVSTINVDGLNQADDGALAGKDVTFDGVALHAATITLDLTNVKLTDYELPAIDFTWDQAHPLTALVPFMKMMANVKIASGTIGSMVLTQEVNSMISETTYEGMQIDKWGDGRIASMTSGAVRTASPKKDPLIAIAMDGVQSLDVDLGAILAVFDPEAYVGGVGDLVWRTIVGHAAYSKMTITAPGVETTIGGMEFDNLRLRQPRGGIQPLYDLSAQVTTGHHDGGMTEIPKPDPMTILDLLSIYGIGKVAIHDVDVSAPGVDAFHLGSFSMADLSSDGIGDFTIADYNIAMASQGAVRLGKFSFGGVVFPPMEAIVAAIAAESSGGNMDVTSVVPHLGYLEVDGLDVAMNAQPHVSLEGFRTDLSNYVGAVPTAVTMNMSGLDLPVDQIPDPKSKAMFQQLGYDRVHMNAAVDIDWSAAGDIVFKAFSFAIDELGAISGDLTLTGITPASVDHLNPELGDHRPVVREGLADLQG